MKNTLLRFKPIQKFINGVGRDIKKFFGKDKGCIVGLGDDGVLYGEGLWEWLRKKNKKINFTIMEEDGDHLE